MYVAAYQENEKTGKRNAGEERKQSIDFRKAACCSSAVVQRAARQKMVCMRGLPGVTGTLGRPTAISTQTKRASTSQSLDLGFIP